MQAIPELSNITFKFTRPTPSLREVTLNGAPWIKLGDEYKTPEIKAKADWGPSGFGMEWLARQLLSVVFEADTPGFGRVSGRVSDDDTYKAAVVERFLAHETRSQFAVTDSDLLAVAPAHFKVLPARKRPTWARRGDKLLFLRPGFSLNTTHIDNARRYLASGHVYTISHIEYGSCSTAVRLEETGDAVFSYLSFERF